MKTAHIQVMVSCASESEAEEIVNALLARRLVACGQILQSVESFYRWQGQIERASECLLLLKTQARVFAAVEAVVLEHHSYEVPEIVATPLVAGSLKYLQWIDEQIN